MTFEIFNSRDYRLQELGREGSYAVWILYRGRRQLREGMVRNVVVKLEVNHQMVAEEGDDSTIRSGDFDHRESSDTNQSQTLVCEGFFF